MPQYRKIEALENIDRAIEETDLFDLDEECLSEIEIEFDKGEEVYIPLYDTVEILEENLIEPSQVTIANILAEVFEIQYLTAFMIIDKDGLWIEEEALN